MLNRSRTIHQEEGAGIDLTPMLDVVFIMLIFFIVTASFVREISINLDRPPESSLPVSEENSNLVVTLQSDNQIFIKDRRVDHRSIRAYLERHKAEYPKAAVIIRAKNRSKTYAMAQISDAARQAGIYKIILNDVE